MVEYSILDGYTLSSMDGCDIKNKTIKHYLAKITGRDDKGNEIREYLPRSHNYDEWFNVSSLEPLDMVRANVWNDDKKFERKKYLVVLSITKHHLQVEEFSTYIKAKNFIDSHQDGNFDDVYEEKEIESEVTNAVEDQDLTYGELLKLMSYMMTHPKQDETAEHLIKKLDTIIKNYKG